MSFAVGSLVTARGREWVVLPESDPDLLLLRPLGGSEEEVTGIYMPLEVVKPATFDLPNPDRLGDFRSSRLLRDALRLGFRSSAGPFRSFARIAIEPRPYQLVPLLMALRLDPVRLLIADDVGIGKTVEAALIARELLDRGEVKRLAVLCPPQLAEQWQRELRGKFNIGAELVLPGTATKLERGLALGQSLFEQYPHVIVSLDFIKSDRRRDEFLRTCPELVIVDEAHTCVQQSGNQAGRSARHQRHQLVSGLASDPDRHLILVTATPHSGNEDAFHSLLRLLNPDFDTLPSDLTGAANEAHRRRLAAHFVQRRRADIRHFLKSETPFPEREEKDETYQLTAKYRQLLDRVLEYAREVVSEADGSHHQRVQWWSVLALLRALASSPAAAAATLRTRAVTLDTETNEEADAIGRRTVFDLTDDESSEAIDLPAGSDAESEEDDRARHRRRLREMARLAEALEGHEDAKLAGVTKLASSLLNDGYQPIIFCRFVHTAEYVAKALRESRAIPKGTEIVAVTGQLAPAEREERVGRMADFPRRVLVATDCLSEGINLQRDFNAVIHYDLSWNPTRHEQREGRVDRFGQPSPKVRVVTYYGEDNGVDRIILRVLLKKHKAIRAATGVSVPVPARAEELVEAIFEDVLMRRRPKDNRQMLLDFGGAEEPEGSPARAVHDEWERAAEREKRSYREQRMFAQETFKFADVAQEIEAVRSAIGSGVDVAEFVHAALRHWKASLSEVGAGSRARLQVNLGDVSRTIRDALPVNGAEFTARFDLPVQPGELYLHRTHPLVEALATGILDASLDAKSGDGAARCGVTRTRSVERRTTLLLLRFRYHIETQTRTREGTQSRQLLAEDCQVLAFAGSPQNPQWLSQERAEALFDAVPDANFAPELQRDALERVLQGIPEISPHLERAARDRAKELLAAHARVRSATRLRGVSQKVEPQLPPDVLGVYVFLPVPAGGPAA
ncbi:MAG: DEAD/DEAH box helicase [Bryobacterales bacterium]|nr:DEAD/DEAH box helicase [Bryobacterales bacterium]